MGSLKTSTKNIMYSRKCTHPSSVRLLIQLKLKSTSNKLGEAEVEVEISGTKNVNVVGCNKKVVVRRKNKYKVEIGLGDIFL